MMAEDRRVSRHSKSSGYKNSSSFEKKRNITEYLRTGFSANLSSFSGQAVFVSEIGKWSF
jgi:hypothetical protein